jgi:hypothetical protein
VGIDELYGFIIIGVAIVVGRWVRDALREAAQEQASLVGPTPARARLDREADAYVDGLVVGAIWDPLELRSETLDPGDIGAAPMERADPHVDGDELDDDAEGPWTLEEIDAMPDRGPDGSRWGR